MSAPTLQELFANGEQFRPTVPVRMQSLAATVLLLTAAAGSAMFSVSSGARKLGFILPTSLCYGFGLLYLLCAAGVYV